MGWYDYRGNLESWPLNGQSLYESEMLEPNTASGDLERLICNECGQRFWIRPDQERRCGECGGPLRHFGPLEGLVDRFFAPPDHVDSQLHHRHVQLVELLWTRDDRAREYYDILKPRMTFSRFTKLVTQLVCRGLAEGWIETALPRAPVPDDRAYDLIFHDRDRFVREMTRLFEPRSRSRQSASDPLG